MTALIVVIPTVILALYLLYEHWPRSNTSLYDKRFRELRDDMKRRKLGPRQMEEEHLFRQAIARLRRRASDAALASPYKARQLIQELTAEEAEKIPNRFVRRDFIKIATEGPISDVLYPKAMKAVDACDRVANKSDRITEDDLASVTTLR